MKLSEYVLPQKTVEGINVGPISFESVSAIYFQKAEKLEAVFDKFLRGGDIDNSEVIGRLVREAPDVASLIIAHGCGEPESAGVAAKMPAPLQIALLEGIAELTFAVEGGLKKTLETVTRVLVEASDLAALPTELLTGSLTSEGK